MVDDKVSNKNASHGELVSLREYVDMRFHAAERAVETRFVAQEKAVGAALEAADRAVTKAEAATERRLEGMNEFRAALSDNSRILMPRAESEARITSVSDRVEELIKRMDAKDGRSAGRSDVWGWIFGAIGLILAFGVLLLKALEGSK